MADRISMRGPLLRPRPLSLAIGVVVMSTAALLQAREPAPVRGEAYALALQERAANRGVAIAFTAPERMRGGTSHAVTSCEDDGSAGTLRAVLGEVVSGDTVDLTGLTCSVITLTQGELDVGEFGENSVLEIDLVGPGRDQLAIDAGGSSTVLAKFHTGSNAALGILRISDLAIRNGSYSGGMASCINSNGRLELTRVDVSDCQTTGGGPQFASAVNARSLSMVDSTVTGSSGSTTGSGDSRVTMGTVYASTAEIVDSTISGNTLNSESSGSGLYYVTAGAGLYVRGDVSISGSTISGNSAETSDTAGGAVGGGVFATGNIVIENSTIDGNVVDGIGGGVFKAPFSAWGDPPVGTTLTIGNSTVSGNTATSGGGVASARPATISNSTIAFNHGESGTGGVLFNYQLEDDLTFDFQSALVAGNTVGDAVVAGADIGATGALTIAGANNLIIDAGDLVTPADTLVDDPLLAPLADNGGATLTHALGEGSPAIDVGNNLAEWTFDQRGDGFARVVGDAADIGAFEYVAEVKDDTIFSDGFELGEPVAQITYQHDDGDGDSNIGPPSSFDPDMLWGNYFLTEPGGEVITQISVAFGPTFPSLADGPVTFWLLDDPDMDFDPTNATSLVSVTGTPDVVNDTFFTVEIPPTPVSGAFFVGASAKLLGGEDRPARVDTGHAGDRSWFFYAPEIADVIDDLASAPFATRMDDPQYVIYPGTFMIRATGTPAD